MTDTERPPPTVTPIAAAADWVAERLAAATGDGRAASLVVSGGRTPEPLHEALAARDLPWERIAVTLADERWVPPDHPDSNAAMVRRTLLRDRAAAAPFTGLYTGHATPEEGEAAVDARLAALPRPWDVVLLGMGTDGHTASLFPDGDRLAAALAGSPGGLCSAMRAPSVPQPRMTLTLPALLEARAIALLIAGEEKLAVLGRARLAGPVGELPIRAVLHQTRVPVAVFRVP